MWAVILPDLCQYSSVVPGSDECIRMFEFTLVLYCLLEQYRNCVCSFYIVGVVVSKRTDGSGPTDAWVMGSC